MATVGHNLAVVDMPKPRLHFGGFFAWMIWMGFRCTLKYTVTQATIPILIIELGD